MSSINTQTSNAALLHSDQQEIMTIPTSTPSPTLSIAREWWGHIMTFLSPYEQAQLEAVNTTFRAILYENNEYVAYKSSVKEGSEFIYRAALSYLNHLPSHELYPKSADSRVFTWARHGSKSVVQLPPMRIITEHGTQKRSISFADEEVMLFDKQPITDAFQVKLHASYEPNTIRQAADALLDIPYTVDISLKNYCDSLAPNSYEHKILSTSRIVTTVFKKTSEVISALLGKVNPNTAVYKLESISLRTDDQNCPIHDLEDRFSLFFAHICMNRAQKILVESLKNKNTELSDTAPIAFPSKNKSTACSTALDLMHNKRILFLNEVRVKKDSINWPSLIDTICNNLGQNKLLYDTDKVIQPFQKLKDQYNNAIFPLSPSVLFTQLKLSHPEDITHNEIKQTESALDDFPKKCVQAFEEAHIEMMNQCPLFGSNVALIHQLDMLKRYIETKGDLGIIISLTQVNLVSRRLREEM